MCLCHPITSASKRTLVPRAVDAVRYEPSMSHQDLQQLVSLIDDIKMDVEATAQIRAERYLKVKPHGIVPNTEFAGVSTECAALFRDGHYFGAIALSQAVAEAIVKFLCTKNGWRPKKVYEENVGKLRTRGFISDSLDKTFHRIWEKRDDYHHLNSTIETDRQSLEALALSKLEDLKFIESEVFKFSIKDGKLVPANPKYWDLKDDGTTEAYLRLK